jgi:leucyl aminopeptidase
MMEYLVKSGHAEKQRVSCIVVGIHARRKPSAAAAALDKASGGAIGSVMRRGDMDGDPGQSILLHDIPNLFADRVLLVGCGRERDFDEAAYRKANANAARALQATGAIDAISFLTELEVKGRGPQWKIKQALLATADRFYRFDSCKGDSSPRPKTRLERLTFNVARRSELPAAEAGLREAQAISRGVSFAKDLGNLPGNICTPGYLADQARDLGRRHGKIRVKVLEQPEMEKLGMGALLSVAKGSRQPPRFIIMEYLAGKKTERPIVLVGKGLTFDAGGISIKPAAKMDEMKYDMCGGASTLAALQVAAELALPINLVGVVPASENLPDGAANKPGDIVKSMAGITIEILNTDAEGRLILCDALTYVERNYEPECVVDMATLTGACVVALGPHASGLFSNTPALARRLLAAGEDIGDRAWELPLWEDYQDMLKSPFADVANVGGRDAGAITAACFLHRFTRKLRWAHLDIAGSAWTSAGLNKGSTGRPVPLLAQFLLNHAARSGDD